MTKLLFVWCSALLPFWLFAQSNYQLTPPLFEVDSLVFQESAQVTLTFGMATANIEYRLHDLNGVPGQVHPYSQPFAVYESRAITARTTATGFEPGDWVRISLLKVPKRVDSIHISSEISPKYPGQGPSGLCDLQRGTQDFKHGQWMGFNSASVELEMFPDKGQVNKIIIGFLDDPGSWILEPKVIEVKGWKRNKWVDVKGKWRAYEKDKFSPQPTMALFEVKQRKMKGLEKYKIEMEQPVLPEGHPGAGMGAWIFTDEILVQ